MAEINKEVPIDIQLEDYIEEEPDYSKLIELYKKLEFNSFLKKLKYRSRTGMKGTVAWKRKTASHNYYK